MQLGAVSDGAHKVRREADRPEPESFVSGSRTTFVAYEAVPVSAVNTGAAGVLTVTDRVEPAQVRPGVEGLHDPVTELHTA